MRYLRSARIRGRFLPVATATDHVHDACRFQVKHEVFHVQTQLGKSFLNQIQNSTSSQDGFRHTLICYGKSPFFRSTDRINQSS